MKKIFCLLYFGLSFSFYLSAKEKKALPSYLQKAYVIQRDAIIYGRPDFDSTQITRIPAGALVTVSKKIYRPETRFGTFYRIYIKKPKKMRAYISEIDVVPRYLKSGSKWKINPNFSQVKKKLTHVKDFQLNRSDPESFLEMGDRPLSDMKFVGSFISYNWMKYAEYESSVPSWFWGMKMRGRGLPAKNLITDFNLAVSVDSPVIGGQLLEAGYLILGEALFRWALMRAPFFELSIGGGAMVKWKSARRPAKPLPPELGAGGVLSADFIFKVHQRLFFFTEGKGYYDFSEGKFIPAVVGGFLLGF